MGNLETFADQIDSVGNHLSDFSTSEKLKSVGRKARTIAADQMRPLKGLRDGILYKVAALEVLTIPLGKQVDQSLSHLKTIQYYVNKQGREIARKVRDKKHTAFTNSFFCGYD